MLGPKHQHSLHYYTLVHVRKVPNGIWFDEDGLILTLVLAWVWFWGFSFHVWYTRREMRRNATFYIVLGRCLNSFVVSGVDSMNWVVRSCIRRSVVVCLMHLASSQHEANLSTKESLPNKFCLSCHFTINILTTHNRYHAFLDHSSLSFVVFGCHNS